MNDIIEDLKNARSPWKWLSQEYKNALLEAKKHNAMVFMDSKGYWQHHKGQESQGVVYRIKKDYKEPVKRPGVPEKAINDVSIRADINCLIDCVEYIYDQMEAKINE